MSTSTPPSAQERAVTIHNLDVQTWRDFQAWCKQRGVRAAGREASVALRQYMRPAPSNRETRQND